MTALTDVLAKHHMAWFEFYAEFRCDCGERFHYAKKFAGEQHAAHVEAELAAAGIVAVQLSEADAKDRWGNPQWGKVVTAYPAMEYAQLNFGPDHDTQRWYPEHLQVLAAALLAAAANAADRPTPTPGDPTP